MHKHILLAFALFLSSLSGLSAQSPTYSEHVAPIIFSHCVSCHRPGEVGPFSLTNYEETKAKLQTVRYAVDNDIMPPWKPASGYGNFVGERRLTPIEKQTILNWIDAGAPEGDKSKMPNLPKFPTGSQLGTPDLVLQVPVKWKVNGNLQDVYRNFVIPTGLLEDKNIAAIEVRPGNTKVVHHVLLWNDISGKGRALDAKDATPGYEDFGGVGFNGVAATYQGWAPGTLPRYFPEGIGMKMYKNSDLIVQIHYAPSATDEEDQTSINIFFKKETDVREITEYALLPDVFPNGYNGFTIPANQKKTFKGSITLNEDKSIAGVFPHMHLLGADAKLYAVTPTKDTIKLINIPKWDFNWQGTYSYKNLQRVPKGSKVYYEATYDNTSNNPFNPNTPPVTINWGFNTTEEMYLCYIFSLPYETGDENISQETTTSVAEEPTFSEPSVINVQGIVPQPLHDGIVPQLNFTLFTDAKVHVELLDMSGRMVASNAEAAFSSGAHSIRLPEVSLSSGVYVCRIHVGGKNVDVPFSVAR